LVVSTNTRGIVKRRRAFENDHDVHFFGGRRWIIEHKGRKVKYNEPSFGEQTSCRYM